MAFPRRIVCLSAESSEILFRVGAGERVVGVSAFAVLPKEAQAVPRVSGFDSANLDSIRRLRPDLIIAYSDVQAKMVAELMRDGFTVLATNQRSLTEIADMTELIGRTVGREEAARRLADDFRMRIKAGPSIKHRSRVYFEEWNDPLISGICWVSELIEIAGGEDIFPEFRSCGKAAQRVVSPDEVVSRNPDIIIASWCGKNVDLDSIRSRAGWGSIHAIQSGHVYEIESRKILQPGPSLLEGLTEIENIVRAWQHQHVGA